ncbi:Crp/Fnr family transcriptional regulator [Paenibacillus periandrae]|uniref:Crp/Fnr family transcriptional regulator n=1 Tax=Paenibacillus periandrae TaxID=1761741 RepID=UPI001F08A61F|nr:Crp/Fnr family transcriptional regulator [Paenibacillus periandrae]
MSEPSSTTNPWDAFIQFGERKFVAKHTVIYNQGDIAKGFYCVGKGLIKIKTCTILGDEKNINFIGPGQMFGELSLIQEPSISTAISAEDSVIYFFTLQRFKELQQQSDQPLMLIFSSMLKKMSVMVEQTFHSTAEQQIAHALLQLYESSGSEMIYIKQKDLAEFSGLTRVTVNKVLKVWKESGIIETENKLIHIKNKELLTGFSKHNTL